MTMNNTTIEAFRKDFAEAMKTLEEKYGVNVRMGSVKYSESEFASKIEVKSNSREAILGNLQKLNSFANLYGITHNGTFASTKYRTPDGKTFIPTDYKMSNHRYPIIAKCLEDGKSYKLAVQQLKMAAIV